jgi:hypothetical protein
MHTAHLNKSRQVPGGAWKLELPLLGGTRPDLFCEQTVSKIGLAHGRGAASVSWPLAKRDSKPRLGSRQKKPVKIEEGKRSRFPKASAPFRDFPDERSANRRHGLVAKPRGASCIVELASR